MLNAAEKQLQQTGISLWLAGLNPQPLQLIQRTTLGAVLGRQRMHFNLEQAILAYKRQAAELRQSAHYY